MQESELQRKLTAESAAETSDTVTGKTSERSDGCVEGTSSTCERHNPSLPDLAVVCVNARDSPTFLNIKARLLQEKQSGELSKVKKLSRLTPITVPKRAIGGFSRSPSSGSPTPTDFSPMLLPRAEENLTALISEHNQQRRQKQLEQQMQFQQFQLQPLQQALPLQQQPLSLKRELESLGADGRVEQPPLKRTKLSKRGRKRQREGSLSGQPIAIAGSRTTTKRSSLGTLSVSVDSDAPPAGATVMRKGPCLPEEDGKLIELVEQFGAYDWSFIADHIPGRVGKQCRERYFNHLAPDVRKEAWTDREDDAIVHAHHVVGNKWTNIAKMLGNGRSPNSIKNRWHSSLKNRLAEHGGEASVMEATGAASGCQCDCKKCDCSCKVACVAFGCQCCSAAHNTIQTELADDGQIVSANTATDDEEAIGGSSSSSASTTPASTTATVPVSATPSE